MDMDKAMWRSADQHLKEDQWPSIYVENLMTYELRGIEYEKPGSENAKNEKLTSGYL